MRRHEISSAADVDALAKLWGMPAESVTPVIDGRPKFETVRDVPSFRTYAAQKIDFIVENCVAASTITMITGEPGCGKSTLATAMCAAIGSGEDSFAGLRVSKRPVLILDRENTLPLIVERFDRLGINDGPNFTVFGGWHPDPVPDPSSAFVINFVHECDPKPVILVDSYSAFLDGDENSSTDTRAFFNGLRMLTHMGASVIVLHHSGKAETSKDYRGSSDIKAAIDIGYTLANLGSSSHLSSLKLKAFKTRFLVEETTFQYVNNRFEIDTRPISKTNEEVMETIIKANPGSSAAELEKLASGKVTRAMSRETIDRFVAEGKVRIEKSRNRSSHFWGKKHGSLSCISTRQNLGELTPLGETFGEYSEPGE